jgi:hypothetical protein
MNEAYLNLGFPIILAMDDWKALFEQFDSKNDCYRTGIIFSLSPNTAIETLKDKNREITAMHFIHNSYYVVLCYIIKKY